MPSLSPRWNKTNAASLVCLCCLHLEAAGSASRIRTLSRPPMRLLSLQPGSSLITPKVTLSIGFRDLVTLLSAILATRFLAFTLKGLTPFEHTSLSWTHSSGYHKLLNPAHNNAGTMPSIKFGQLAGLCSRIASLRT